MKSRPRLLGADRLRPQPPALPPAPGHPEPVRNPMLSFEVRSGFASASGVHAFARREECVWRGKGVQGRAHVESVLRRAHGSRADLPLSCGAEMPAVSAKGFREKKQNVPASLRACGARGRRGTSFGAARGSILREFWACVCVCFFFFSLPGPFRISRLVGF